jgi:hypothetical protein
MARNWWRIWQKQPRLDKSARRPRARFQVEPLEGRYLFNLFSTPQNFTAGTRPVFVVVGDLNGDGKLDRAVANEGSSNESVLLGNGNSTFRAATPLVRPWPPLAATLGRASCSTVWTARTVGPRDLVVQGVKMRKREKLFLVSPPSLGYIRFSCGQKASQRTRLGTVNEPSHNTSPEDPSGSLPRSVELP